MSIHSNFYNFDKVKVLEVELTTYCNASCGACFRNINGGQIAPHVNLKHMSDETWSSIIDPKNLTYINTFLFDGNLGDAAMHPELIPMLEKLSKVKNDICIRISTNGGPRNTEWWADLAKCLSKNFSHHLVSFSIDGLEDTNHIYRRGVVWDKLIKNLKSFNDAGGNSRWRSIVFNHNKHQIEEMSNLANDLGCVNFITFRNRQPIIKMDKYKKFDSYIITGPDINEFSLKYSTYKQFKPVKLLQMEKIGDDNFSCPFAEYQKVALDETGNVWPCCFTAATPSLQKFPPKEEYKIFNNIKNNSLENILYEFRKDLYPAWREDKYGICNNCLHKSSPPTGISVSHK